MPTMSGGLHRKPYIIREGYAVPTLTSIAPTTAVNGVGTIALTCTGTFALVGGQFQVLFKGVAYAATYVSGTSLTATIVKTGLPAGTYPVTVVDAMGNLTAAQTFTLT